MPVYEFRCTSCDELFDVTRPASDTSAVSCPHCSAPAKRVFSPVGVVFKGSGFHNTDYRTRPSDRPDAAPDKPAPCGADKPADGACAGCPAASE